MALLDSPPLDAIAALPASVLAVGVGPTEDDWEQATANPTTSITLIAVNVFMTSSLARQDICFDDALISLRVNRAISAGLTDLAEYRTALEVTRTVMNTVLWVLQVLLAVAFLAHGWLMLFPPADMVELMNSLIPPAFRIFIGVAEVLAAVGLTLPGITRVLPWLVPSAAAGLMIVMISATILHVTRGEVSSAITTALLFVALTFVAYMRWKVKPILPRTVAQ